MISSHVISLHSHVDHPLGPFAPFVADAAKGPPRGPQAPQTGPQPSHAPVAPLRRPHVHGETIVVESTRNHLNGETAVATGNHLNAVGYFNGF